MAGRPTLGGAVGAGRRARGGSQALCSTQVIALSLLAGLCALGMVLSRPLAQGDRHGDVVQAVTPPVVRPTRQEGSGPGRPPAQTGPPPVVDVKGLAFISVPFNAGEAVRGLAKDLLDRKLSSGTALLGDGDTCARLNVPPALQQWAYTGKDTFCVVRDPYERMISAFRHSIGALRNNPVACYNHLNAFLNESLRRVAGHSSREQRHSLGPHDADEEDDEVGPARPYSSDCAFLPQAAFVFGWQGELARVDNSEKWCKHVLRFESLVQEANDLFRSAGAGLQLGESPVDPRVCTMLTSRFISPESRSLIEEVFRDDFRLLGYLKWSGPEFIHVPRTGGTTIEDVARRFESWGRLHPKMNSQTQWIGKSGAKCYKQHIPPAQLAEVYGNGERETFCIVRDVFARMVSTFGYDLTGAGNAANAQYQCTASELNRYVIEHLSHKWSPGFDFPYGSDCHFLPQGGYVYAWDEKTSTFDKSKRFCTHVIRFERLREQLNGFFESHGYPMRLEKHKKNKMTATKGDCEKLRVSDLNQTSVDLINRLYKDDIEMLKELDAEEANRPPPPPRPAAEEGAFHRPEGEEEPSGGSGTLVLDDRYLEDGKLVRSDVRTAEEFEISFDIWVLSVAGHTTSLLRLTNSSTHYGHLGDRMPAFLFMMKTTRLMVYMGHADDHNANCITPEPGLPLGRSVHVSGVLSGSQFKVFANGKLLCTVDGYHRKYSPATGVSLFLGDTFNLASDSAIGNVTYRPKR